MAKNGAQEPKSRAKRPIVRAGSFIDPSTGERLQRALTLRDPDIFGFADQRDREEAVEDETTPLLGAAAGRQRPRWRQLLTSAYDNSRGYVNFWISTEIGQGILKCSLAYLLATLAIYVIPLEAIYGRSDSKHMIANYVVWFHPARSAGSMHYGTGVAFIAFLYALVLSYLSMAISFLFATRGLLALGHAIIIVLVVGGGLGFMAWFKQYMGEPLIAVSCSLAAGVVSTVLTREGAIHHGVFSHAQISTSLKMLITAIIISTVINLVVWPVFARKKLKQSFVNATDAFSDVVTAIVVCFLDGSEDDMKLPGVTAASEALKKSLSAITTQTKEAKFEQYLLGKEKLFGLQDRLGQCMQQLSSDLGGLRSAAATQYSLLAETSVEPINTPTWKLDGPIGQDGRTLEGSKRLRPPPILDRIDETSETLSVDSVNAARDIEGQQSYASRNGNETLKSRILPESDDEFASRQPTSSLLSVARASTEDRPKTPSAASPAEIFTTFIQHLGPPMKALAITLKQILDDIPYGGGSVSKGTLSINPNYRPSLVRGIWLFNRKRKEALDLVYQSKDITIGKSIPVAADFEEVAASCGYFSSSLQDLAENCVKLLEILEQMQSEVSEHKTLSWSWLKFWRWGKTNSVTTGPDNGFSLPSDGNVNSTWNTNGVADLKDRKRPLADRPPAQQRFPYSIYPYVRIFRREDIRFAIKVGVGAILLAMLSYIPSTEPFYAHWRLEWSLVAYMFVCAMNIGAANNMTGQRIIGTAVGAIYAVFAWIVSRRNPYILAFLSWLLSIGGFYIMLAKGRGPMTRFIILTYNLCALYSYSLSIHDDPNHRDDDEGGIDPWIWEITLHRVVSVLIGIVWGMFITTFIWPIKARKKLRLGLSLLWLRMGLIWKDRPLAVLLQESETPSAFNIASGAVSLGLREYLTKLETLFTNAQSEFDLRGPFSMAHYDSLLKCTGRMLDALHALRVVILKDLKATPGEKEILDYTAKEREEVSKRLSHLLSVLASSMKLQYPLNDTLPNLEHTRDRLLAKIYEFRQLPDKAVEPTEHDYELLYAYALATRQIAKEIDTAGKNIETLFGSINESIVALQ